MIKAGRSGFPGRVTSCLERIADATRWEGLTIRLLLNQGVAGEQLNGPTVVQFKDHAFSAVRPVSNFWNNACNAWRLFPLAHSFMPKGDLAAILPVDHTAMIDSIHDSPVRIQQKESLHGVWLNTCCP